MIKSKLQHEYEYVCVHAYKSKLVTVVEGDPNDPFSLATTLRCKGRR